MQIPVHKPAIRRKEMDAVLSCMVEDKIGSGEKLQELCSWFQDNYSLMTAFGLREYRRAIEFGYRSFSLEVGSTIVLSPFAHRYFYDVGIELGFNIVCLDVETLKPLMNIPEDLIARINPALIVIDNALGWVYDLGLIQSFNVPIIEDITMAYGASFQDIPVGTLGDIVILRMEEYDPVPAGGGVMIGARDKQKSDFIYQSLSDNDTDLLLTDMNASLAISMIKAFDENQEQVKVIYSALMQSVFKSSNQTFSKDEESQAALSCFPLIVQTSVKEAIQFARKKNVELRLAFKNIVLERLEDTSELPMASSLALRVVLVPFYSALGKKNLDLVAKVVSSLP